MKRKSSVAFHLLLVLVLSQAAAWAQSKTFSEDSFGRARQVLERGIQALGGLKNFQAVEDISFKSSAKVPEIGQSANPDATYYVRPLDQDGVLDLRGKRFYAMRKSHFLGNIPFWGSYASTGKSAFHVDLLSNVVYPVATSGVANIGRTAQRLFPHLILQLARSRAGTLRWLGEQDYEGRNQQVITFADSDGSQNTLYFDAQTGLLTKIEGLADSPLNGLTTNETAFSEYRDVGNVKMPFRAVNKFDGEMTSDFTYSEIKTNTHPDAALFEMPKGAEMGPEVGGPPQQVTLTKLGKDAYYINGVSAGSFFFYSSMFVAFKDYVLVIEAPLSDSLSQAVIAKIKETVPGKPIKYLVPTHYHNDHLGGIRGYIAEGATILTTPANRGIIEKVASAVHPLNVDTLSLHPRQLSLETFTDKRVFSDGEHVVELYNVGPTPHVDEMVIAYLPQEKVVFESDLFQVYSRGRIGPANPVDMFFEQKLRQLGLQVETIAGGHGRLGTIDELRKSISERQAQSTSADNTRQYFRAVELPSLAFGTPF